MKVRAISVGLPVLRVGKPTTRGECCVRVLPHKQTPVRLALVSGLFGLRCVEIGRLVLGLASGLEAFSREPPCDGFGALAARQTPETSGMAWEFLSYYPKLPSRHLRVPPC